MTKKAAKPLTVLGRRIRARLDELGMTQAQLAEELGKSGDFVSRTLLRGEKIPLEELRKTAKALSCSTDYLLGLDPSPACREPQAHYGETSKSVTAEEMEAFFSVLRRLIGVDWSGGKPPGRPGEGGREAGLGRPRLVPKQRR